MWSTLGCDFRVVTVEGTCIKPVGRPIAASTLLSLREQRDNLRELVMNPIPFSETPAVSALLDAGMPHLEQLHIGMKSPEPGDDPRPLVTFELPPAKYPALRSLVLDNSAALVTPSLVSHLWRLVIKGGVGFTQRLPLAPFLDCMSSFKCLEELVIENCFSPPVEGLYRASRSVLAKSRIIDVSLEDHPATISQILSSVVLPSNGTVRLIGNLRGVSSPQECFAAFKAMFPNDRRCLPILQRLVRVDVYHAPEACYMMAKSEDEDLFDLELITDALHIPSLKSVRGELFELMVRGVREVFIDSPIERLSFLGDIDYVPRTTWISCLSQFPRLHELEVDDVDLRASPEEVVAALHTSTTSATLGTRPICAALDSLEIYGDLPSVNLFGTIHECLAWRKQQNSKATILRNLRLSLYSDIPVSFDLFARYKQDISQLAETRRVEVIVESGRRSRYY